MSLLKRNRDVGGRGAAGVVAASPSPSMAELPTLWEFLTLEQWDDGAKRVTGSLLLFADDGSLKIMLNDRDSGKVAFRTLRSGECPFVAAEDALCDASTDWRGMRKAKGR